ncbi:MAG TPA: glycosyltransferase family 2 protein [Solirubrobacteraceae bacterium]|jgi:glycosyltransferase involved in cell wall biosynthesis|nr:glycosyltransferase family 2 protein [Solirubrobacteraceae bacterium]
MSTITENVDVSDEHDSTHQMLSVVIPCLNEAENIELCVALALEAIARADISGEVIVADNGSEDGSAQLAEQAGARVVHQPLRGYGSAYLAGFAAAQGEYIVMADADLTYDFADIPRFLAGLEDGADMVVGDRMANIHPGAMPWLHRYIGNPLLSGFLNVLFHTGINDAHCGMRAVRRDRLEALGLRTRGMEFASEMIVRAAKEKLDIREISIEYHPRGGESKLSSFRDGWRHLRFLLLHSPNHLFILPGLLIAALGALTSLTVLTHIHVLQRHWDVHTLIGGSLLLIVGSQLVGLGLCAHAYATYFMGERDAWFDRARERLRLEHGLMAGSAVALAGLVMIAVILIDWIAHGFGSLAQERAALFAATLLVLGIQIVFTSFLLSILGLRRD